MSKFVEAEQIRQTLLSMERVIDEIRLPQSLCDMLKDTHTLLAAFRAEILRNGTNGINGSG